METERTSSESLEETTCEIWKPVKGFEGLYEVSNMGRVRSLDRVVYQKNKFGRMSRHIYYGQIIKQQKQRNGYFIVNLYRNGQIEKCLVHRLVGSCFLEKKDGKDCINHLDCDKSNNRAENLEWCTQSENVQYAYDVGAMKPPHMRKVAQYSLDGVLLKVWESQSEASRNLGIYQSNIYKVCSGKRNQTGGFIWKYID